MSIFSFDILFMLIVLPDTTLCINRAWYRHMQDTGLCPVEAAFIFIFLFLSVPLHLSCSPSLNIFCVIFWGGLLFWVFLMAGRGAHITVVFVNFYGREWGWDVGHSLHGGIAPPCFMPYPTLHA